VLSPSLRLPLSALASPRCGSRSRSSGSPSKAPPPSDQTLSLDGSGAQNLLSRVENPAELAMSLDSGALAGAWRPAGEQPAARRPISQRLPQLWQVRKKLYANPRCGDSSFCSAACQPLLVGVGRYIVCMFRAASIHMRCRDDH